MLLKWKKQDNLSQNMKNKVMTMDNIDFKFKIDGLTYWTIDSLISEKNVQDYKFQLDTNRFIKAFLNKALREFILNHQYLMTEKLNRGISLLDDKLDGKEVKFEEIFQIYNLNPKAKEGGD